MNQIMKDSITQRHLQEELPISWTQTLITTLLISFHITIINLSKVTHNQMLNNCRPYLQKKHLEKYLLSSNKIIT